MSIGSGISDLWGSKHRVFDWQGESPLQQFCNTVQTVIAVMKWLFGNHVRTDTADGLSVTATALVEDVFGWAAFTATVLRQISHIVNTAAGAEMTANTMKMSPSSVKLVILLPRLL